MGDDRSEREKPRTVGDVIGGMRISTAAAVLGLVVVLVGSVGPWVDTFLGSVGGLRGDGRITLGAAAVALAALAVGRGGRVARALAGIAAAVALGTAGYDFVHIRHAAAGATLFGHQVADVGWGPVAALLGATIALAALVMEERQSLRWGVTALAVGGAVGALVGGALQSTRTANGLAQSVPTISTLPTTPASASAVPTTPTSASAVPTISPIAPTLPEIPTSPTSSSYKPTKLCPDNRICASGMTWERWDTTEAVGVGFATTCAPGGVNCTSGRMTITYASPHQACGGLRFTKWSYQLAGGPAFQNKLNPQGCIPEGAVEISIGSTFTPTVQEIAEAKQALTQCPPGITLRELEQEAATPLGIQC